MIIICHIQEKLLIPVIITIYSILAAALVILGISSTRASILQRRQTRLILTSAIVPWISSIIYTSSLNPLPGPNLVPSTLFISSTLILFNLRYHKFLDLLPIARNLLESQILAELSAWADVDMTETVIRNITTNAIKFTHSGGKVILSYKVDTKIYLSISETCVGKEQKRFDKLFRIETVKSAPGTAGEAGSGLGLIICKNFIEMQGESIDVKSKIGEGSTFTITLAQPEGSI
ncbi:hypothetical protein KAR48_20185 [bacterium]|nr:hypothetical protein [bacterium]